MDNDHFLHYQINYNDGSFFHGEITREFFVQMTAKILGEVEDSALLEEHLD
jgi:hypothetical protein